MLHHKRPVPEDIHHVPQVELANFLHLLALLVCSGSTEHKISHIKAPVIAQKVMQDT
jgi:hypothetical protein